MQQQQEREWNQEFPLPVGADRSGMEIGFG